MAGIPGENGIDAVVEKMNDHVRVVTVRDLLSAMLVVNWRLERAGHRRLHGPTLQVMLEEAVEMMFRPETFGPEAGEEAAD
jgi:hypothetical protein